MPKRTTYGKRTPRRRRTTRRPTKYARARKSYARPMSAMRANYRSMPNQYRFVRESIPIVLDLGVDPGAQNVPFLRSVSSTMKEINFKTFTMQGKTIGSVYHPGLSDFTTDFAQLYQRYKVDKIEFILRPMWHYTNSHNIDLLVTRISSKYQNQDLTGGTEAQIKRAIAQTQLKSQSGYSDKRPLKVVTTNPRVYSQQVLANPTPTAGHELTTMKQPWLNTVDQSTVEFASNCLVFLERRDGEAFTQGAYKYEVKARVTFRCCQVS